MKVKHMNKFVAHCDRCFQQKIDFVAHMVGENGIHVDVLVYEPNETYPFWKLVTMGASDYDMAPVQPTFGLNNEYVMFADKSVDLKDENIFKWYYDKLINVATFAYFNDTHVTYGNSFYVNRLDDEDEMVYCFIEIPQIIREVSFLHCKVGFSKVITCLQVVLLNEEEVEKLKDMGGERFSYWLNPESEQDEHFIVEKKRTEKF